jgi:hypothetical protein
MYLLGGIFLLALAAATYTALWKIGRHFDRAAFNRRNATGLEQFSTYDEKEKTRLKEAGGRLLMNFLIFVVFLPCLLGGIGLVAAHFMAR